MRVVGYRRISTQEQVLSGAGLEAQRTLIDSEATRRGWDVRWIEDAGYSAKNLNRPGIQEALRLLRAHEADALVIAKLDRLSRSLLDFAGIVELSRREGWGIVSLDLGVDSSTPAGEMLANVLAVFAHFERRLIGQRTKEALAQRKLQGVRLGRPPSLPDRVRKRIVEARLGGATLQGIAAHLNNDQVPTAHGGQAWHASTVHSVIKRGERDDGLVAAEEGG